MKISLKWLKDYIDIKLSPQEVADKLTMAGNEVGRVSITGANWENIVIGEVKAVSPHPNADRIRLATVETGKGEVTVVCGAPNLYPGEKVAFAYTGARLFDGHTGEPFKLKASKIRGVVSEGMCCSEKELGLSQQHEGIIELPKDAPLGMSLAEYMGDAILDLEVTPNRPDCLSVLGIARELSALTGEPVHVPEISYSELELPVGQKVKVTIADPELCSRYSASYIEGIKVGESPDWLKKRLTAAGMRPINNIVDITNFVMLEFGQPLHAFDYDKIAGQEIIVRRGHAVETIVSLDGVTRTLHPDVLAIADRDRAVAIAGVMGGASSEVTENTTNILLESANFTPTSIHYTSRMLGLPSEASQRFERGISRELTVPALRRATGLMTEIAGGKAAKGVVDNYPGKHEPERVTLTLDRAKTVLGMPLTLEQVKETLESLGFYCDTDASGGSVTAVAPYWRSDIHIADDLAEEVARITGYEKIPLTLLNNEMPRQTPEKAFTLKRKVRENLLGQGYQEIISFSLTNEAELNLVMAEPPLRLVNPMTEDQSCLRTSLRVGLLAALSANRRFEEGGIRLFELGKVYLPNPGRLPDEPEMLSGLVTGDRFERSWQGQSEPVDFYDAKGTVEELIKELGITAEFTESQDKSLTSGKQASVIVSGNSVGVIGEVHPKVLTAFELSEPVFLFELNLTALYGCVAGDKPYQSLPRFPAVSRDIALVLDEGLTHKQILDIITGFPLVTDVKLFDVYSGKQVPAGKKSLAYRITFQSPEHTLTDEDVSGVMDKMLAILTMKFGATLRA